MPWIYYLNNTQDYILNNDQAVYTYNFETVNTAGTTDQNQLEFWVKKISLTGELVDELSLANQLTPCSFSDLDKSRMTKYGNYSIKTCTIDSTQQFFSEPQYFYELFLKTGPSTYTEVPVAFSGFVTESGARPNDQVQNDVSSMRFFRRFFVYDKLSGIPGTTLSDLTNRDPQYIRILQSASIYIRVVVDKSDNVIKHKIKSPFLYVKYNDFKNDTASKELVCEFQVIPSIT